MNFNDPNLNRRQNRQMNRALNRANRIANREIRQDIKTQDKANIQKMQSFTGPLENYSSGGQTNNKKDWSKYIGVAQSVGSVIDAFTQAKTDPSDSQAQIQNQVRGGISDAAIQSGNPIAMAIGVGSKLVDAIGAQTGLNLDNIDKEAGKDSWKFFR